MNNFNVTIFVVIFVILLSYGGVSNLQTTVSNNTSEYSKVNILKNATEENISVQIKIENTHNSDIIKPSVKIPNDSKIIEHNSIEGIWNESNNKYVWGEIRKNETVSVSIIFKRPQYNEEKSFNITYMSPKSNSKYYITLKGKYDPINLHSIWVSVISFLIVLLLVLTTIMIWIIAISPGEEET